MIGARVTNYYLDVARRGVRLEVSVSWIALNNFFSFVAELLRGLLVLLRLFGATLEGVVARFDAIAVLRTGRSESSSSRKRIADEFGIMSIELEEIFGAGKTLTGWDGQESRETILVRPNFYVRFKLCVEVSHSNEKNINSVVVSQHRFFMLLFIYRYCFTSRYDRPLEFWTAVISIFTCWFCSNPLGKLSSVRTYIRTPRNILLIDRVQRDNNNWVVSGQCSFDRIKRFNIFTVAYLITKHNTSCLGYQKLNPQRKSC
jgi:hypothetical protein